MPYKRTYRKRTYRRKTGLKRTYRRRFNTRNRYNKRGQKLYLFKRHVDFGQLVIDNIADTFRTFNFSLQDVPNETDFTNLYDVYKINAVKITFIPQMNTSISIGSINNPNANARFFSVLDYNDGNPLTTIDQAREYQSCKYTPILRQHKRYLRPKIMDAGGVYNPGNKWLATSNITENYFGVKVAVEPMDSTGTLSMTYSIECVYYMSFRNVK